jgi:hypothetical protein
VQVKGHFGEIARYQQEPFGLFWERDRNDYLDLEAARLYACQTKAWLREVRDKSVVS